MGNFCHLPIELQPAQKEKKHKTKIPPCQLVYKCVCVYICDKRTIYPVLLQHTLLHRTVKSVYPPNFYWKI